MTLPAWAFTAQFLLAQLEDGYRDDTVALEGVTGAELRSAMEQVGLPLAVASDQLLSQLAVVPSEGGEVVRVVVPLFAAGSRRASTGLAVRLDHLAGIAWHATIEGLPSVSVDLPPGSERPPPSEVEGAVILDDSGWSAGDDPPVPVRWREAIREAVRRLVGGDVDGLVVDGLMPDDGRSATIWDNIEGYVEPIVEMPERAWDHADFDDLGSSGISWLEVSLWTATGPSQLTLDAELDKRSGEIMVTVLNVHVM